MADKIDVLAVMDDSICGMEQEGVIESLQVSVDALRDARAAVAELVEASTLVANERHTHEAIGSADGGEACTRCGCNWRDTSRHFRVGETKEDDVSRLRAALAKFGGAS